MASPKFSAIFFICKFFTLIALPRAYSWGKCDCPPSHPPYHRPSPPKTPRPHPPIRPHPPSTPRLPNPPTTHPPYPPSSKPPPKVLPPIINPPIVVPPIITPPPIISPPVTNPPGVIPPIISPPIINPPVTRPPPSSGGYPPYTPSPPGGGGGGGSGGVTPPASATCPINALKLGLCLDVLGGLIHIGIGNPVENVCCPVLQGLLEIEAAVCLCTGIRLKLLNLNIFLPLALQVIITCGQTPPPGFVCPPLP
ncbi:hypothetical protein ACH5RR_038641 [Cinchona calisaya]|uniref:Hydrophobic seed protein domain-containing protein n=1 Tax=Cinchona calisaya TaxID=153742 RepID=A0ABD2Y1H6_9GENT